MDLKKLNWKEFLFSDIFIIKNGFYNKKPTSSGLGKIPFLGATANNNGVTGFYLLSEIEESSKVGYGKNERLAQKIFEGNCIAVTNNGSVGYAYYQTSSFTCSHDVNPLYLKKRKLNPYIAKFLIAAIERQRVCFEYARKWRPIRMRKSKILLPANSDGEPDFAFMEEYIKKKEKQILDRYIKYVEARIKQLKDVSRPKYIGVWKEFFIDDVFVVKSGKRLTKADMTSGQIPFIGATDANNGITEFTGSKNASLDKNVLGVNYNGSVVENFYHPYEAVFSDDVKRLSLSKTENNKAKLLFCKAVILMQKEKYEYGYKFNGERMKRQKIMLPTDKKGNPDYQYMNQFMSSLECEKLIDYLNFKKNVKVGK